MGIEGSKVWPKTLDLSLVCIVCLSCFQHGIHISEAAVLHVSLCRFSLRGSVKTSNFSPYYALFYVHLVGLFICVQARAVPGVCRLLHVCSSEDITQPVSPTYQNTRRLHLPTKLDHGQGDAQPSACHDLPQQGQVCRCRAFH